MRPVSPRAVLVLLVAAVAALFGSTAVRAASPVHRGTPRQTVTGFLSAADDEDTRRAARYVQLRGRGRRRVEETVDTLADVLHWRAWVDPSALSDAPEGDPDDGDDIERIATVDVDGERIPITLVRVRRNGAKAWVFSAMTVSRIPEIVAPGAAPTWLTRVLPSAWREVRLFGLWSWQWFGLLLALVLGLPLGYVIGRSITFVLRKVAARTPAYWDDAVVVAIRPGLRFAFAWGVMGLLVTSLDLPVRVALWVGVVARTPLILVGGWMMRGTVAAITEAYLQRTRDDSERGARGLRTQIVILRRLSTVAILLVVLALVLMQFQVVRTVGWSLLASAGVAGVALGFAAQKSLGDVIAGLQLSMSQPIRLGDAVVIKGEWGQIEEIALTYVRVQLWDERRMIVPTAVFLHEIFENWSAPGDGLIGIVDLAVDPGAPVAAIRAELERLAAEHPTHDGRECNVQVVDLNEHRALLRARVSTAGVDGTFQMRCDLREGLMTYLQQLDGGRHIARQRWETIDPGHGRDSDRDRERIDRRGPD